MFKRNNSIYIFVIILSVVIFSFMTIYAASSTKHSGGRGFGLSAVSAVLYEPETKTFLYKKASQERMPMASTTKIMTALVALEHSDLAEIVPINENAIGIEGSSAYLRSGDELTMEELLYALMLNSANDAAVAIAYHIGGNIDGFASLMNDRATMLGLSNTHFANPHGLDAEDHYTTAEDLAVIAAAALENDNFKKITSTYKKSFITETRSRTYINHNKLLRSYDGCVGVKTGYTKRCGRCLVGAAERDGLRFISVTLNAQNDWSDHTRLLDYGFSSLEKIELASPLDFTYTLGVISSTEAQITAKNTDSASVIVEKGDHKIEKAIKLPRFVIAPVKEGDVLGEVIFTVDGEYVSSIKLYAEKSLAKNDKTILQKIISKLHKRSGKDQYGKN